MRIRIAAILFMLLMACGQSSAQSDAGTNPCAGITCAVSGETCNPSTGRCECTSAECTPALDAGTTGNSAAYVSETVPAQVNAGAKFTVTVTMQNTGSTGWALTETKSYFLGSQDPQDNMTWGTNRAGLEAGMLVSTGQSYTFTINLTAPAAGGTYPMQWQMLQDSVGWFGQKTPVVMVTVVGATTTPDAGTSSGHDAGTTTQDAGTTSGHDAGTPPPPDAGTMQAGCSTGTGTNGATFVSQNVPQQVDPGSTFTVSFTLQNSGTTTWWRAPSMGFFLGSQDPMDNTTWGTNRGWMDSSACVSPGQSYTFTFQVTAPSTPGTYPMQWQMLQDAVQWFGDMTPVVDVTVGSSPPPPACSTGSGANGATFVSQNVPSVVASGSTFTVQVTMQNSGASTWWQAPSMGFFLGSDDPMDNSTWGTNRGWMDSSACISPGQPYTFTFQVTAPSTPGTYPMQWQMLQDAVEWFGDTTPVVTVSVVTPGSSGIQNAAAFVSQNVPTTVSQGSTFDVQVTMQNLGDATWTQAGDNGSDGWFLGSQDPMDNSTWGTNRGWLGSSDSVSPGATYTFTMTLTAPSSPGTYTMQWQMLQNSVEWFGQMTPVTTITVTTMPPPPTRDQISAVKLTFQGLTVTLPDYGTIPWFEPAISSLSAEDRQIVYAAKHAAGDTHIIIALTWNYSGDNGYAYPVPGTDLSGNLPAFRALVQEAIQNGFYVMAFLGGDGESNPSGGYNDPVGWTYGYSWLMDHLDSIVGSLQQPTDLTPYVIFVPGWDSVVPGWAPDASNPSSGTYVYPAELDNYLLKARSLVGPNGYLGVELAGGYCHWGGGIANYITPEGQSGPSGGQALDIILQEFPGPPTGDQVWQIAARELGPAYHRPPDEPANDDPSPPFYLSGGTPRGPWTAIGFEFDEYRWVRNAVSAGDVQTEHDYLLSVGYPNAD